MTMRRFARLYGSFRGLVAVAGCLAGLLAANGARAASPEPGRMHFKLIDARSGRTVPAMVCITGQDGSQVFLPPEGEVCKTPPFIEPFVAGVQLEEHADWIGPVRKTSAHGGNQGRAEVYDKRRSIPWWPEPMMYMVSGDFTISLPPGQWRISVEHGMEYVPVFEPFETRAGETTEKTISLERWINLPALGWYSGDVHVHHPLLDAKHEAFLMRYAMAEDVHVVNLLEMGHHKGTDFKQRMFGRKARVQKSDYCLVVGQEDPRSTFGHIIGLNLQSMVRDLSTYDFYDITFRGIHEQPGALVGFAHVAWRGCDYPRGFPWYVTTGELDFIEVLQFSVLNAMDYYDYLNLGFKLTAAAGSDVPWGSTIGEVRTYVYTGPEFTIDAWFDGLKKGRSFVSNGPALEFTVNGELPGTTLPLDGKADVEIRAKVASHPAIGKPTSLTIVGNQGVIQEALNSEGKPEISVAFNWPIQRSQWLVAAATCDNGAVAHATPVYITVDGKPTWSAEHGPGIIGRQLEAIAKIEAEFAGDDPRSAGVRERLAKARDYYLQLRSDMLK